MAPLHDIIVIGASAAGLDGVSTIVRSLPAGLPASIFIVCHYPPGHVSALPTLLSARGKLLASHPRDGEPIHPGHIYIAPPDHHMIVEEGQVRINRGPRENNLRPSIDPLFRSAARTFGPRVIGVILAGSALDGVAGLLAVRAAGGTSIVQDPRSVLISALPKGAQEIAGADHVVKPEEIGPLLVKLVTTPVDRGKLAKEHPVPADVDNATVAQMTDDFDDQKSNGRNGKISTYTCPECGGPLWQVDDDKLVRFRCHVGHAYNGDDLLEKQSRQLEAALWTAVRTFRERSVLSRQLASRERRRGAEDAAGRFEESAQVAEGYSDVIQRYLLQAQPMTDDEPKT